MKGVWKNISSAISDCEVNTSSLVQKRDIVYNENLDLANVDELLPSHNKEDYITSEELLEMNISKIG